MGWWILVFYPEPLASMNYFNSDMSNSTNTVVYFDWKMVIYIYICGQLFSVNIKKRNNRVNNFIL